MENQPHPVIDELRLVREFGVGILNVPAKKVMQWRRIMIAEYEMRPDSGGAPASKEAAFDQIIQQHKRRTAQ